MLDKIIYSVSEINHDIKNLLEDEYSNIWITGELSNLAKPSSGHWYFTLKDPSAQLRSAMFRMANRKVDFQLEEGMQINVYGNLSLYPQRGDFQFIASKMEEIGDGKLKKAFEALKNKLEKEGLFELKHKKTLPSLPKCIGIITSPTGAALHDILIVLKKRFPSIPIIIYPTSVQGNEAAANIVKAIQTANQRKECDVLIVGRGGGSLEDLWPFNEENVAREIFASQLPIISAVGHEVDTTISDYVADQRAATPSAAAEIVSPDRDALLKNLQQLNKQLYTAITSHYQRYLQHFKHIIKNLKDPRLKIQEHYQTLDKLEAHLFRTIQQCLQQYRLKWVSLSKTLNALSPLNTLDRGYAIITDKNKNVISKAVDASLNSEIIVKLQDANLLCKVLKKISNKD